MLDMCETTDVLYLSTTRPASTIGTATRYVGVHGYLLPEFGSKWLSKYLIYRRVLNCADQASHARHWSEICRCRLDAAVLESEACRML